MAASTGGILAAALQTRRTSPRPTDDADTRTAVLDRLAVYQTDASSLPNPSDGVNAVAHAATIGFDRLLTEHRQMWAGRWEDADVVVEGDDELQLAIRFALFHLMASVADSGEAGVGARGLTGTGYRGHVFWDADTFVLPFFAATHPASARSMLEYRLRATPRRHGGGARRGSSRSPVPMGIRSHRSRRHADERPRPVGAARAHPHRPARGAHRRPGGLGGVLLRGLVRRR